MLFTTYRQHYGMTAQPLPPTSYTLLMHKVSARPRYIAQPPRQLRDNLPAFRFKTGCVSYADEVMDAVTDVVETSLVYAAEVVVYVGL